MVPLSACGGVQGTESTTSAAASSSEDTSSESASPEASSSSAEESTDTSMDDMTVKFGNTYQYEDGVSVLVGNPTKFHPSEYAVTGKGSPVEMQVTVKNGSKKAYDPAVFSMTASSGQAEAEQIFDSEKGLNGSPSTKVLPGKTVKFKVGFSVKNPKDLTVEVSPGFEYENAIYTK